MDTYPQNKAHTFTNVMPHSIYLPPVYKIGLSSIEFSNDFYTISPSVEHALEVYDFLAEREQRIIAGRTITTYGQLYKVNIVPGFYKSCQAFIDHINDALRKCGIKRLRERKPVFYYDKIRKRCHFKIEQFPYLQFRLRGELVHILGCGSHDINLQYTCIGADKKAIFYTYTGKKEKSTIDSTVETSTGSSVETNSGSTADIDKRSTTETNTGSVTEIVTDVTTEKRFFEHPEAIPSTAKVDGYFPFVMNLFLVDTLIIYCSLVHPYINGKNYSSELTSIALSLSGSRTEGGGRIIKRFNEPVMHELSTHNFNTISIAIRDIHGKNINFLSGHVKLLLKFEKQQTR